MHNTEFAQFEATEDEADLADEANEDSEEIEREQEEYGSVIDWSDNDSMYFYEKIFKDDHGLTFHTAYKVRSAWQFEQIISYEQGEVSMWFTCEIIYTGRYFAQRFRVNGNQVSDISFEPTSDNDLLI